MTSFSKLLQFSLKRGNTDAERIIADHIISFGGPVGYNDELTVECAVLALQFFGEKYWPKVWVLINMRQDLADSILHALSELVRRYQASFANKLSESHLGELYLYTSERFPPEEDPKMEDVDTVGPRELLADFRTGLLMTLVNRGTREACKVIQSLLGKLPNQRPLLLLRLREAQIHAAQKTWIPPTTENIIALLQNGMRRYVENEEQLLDVLIESLSRMQSYYKGELTPVERLWSYEGAGLNRQKFRPKDEESLSDEITRWLREDLSLSKGIVVNREVQPQRGQKTDIYVNAVRLAGASKAIERPEVLSVAIEVKGCWHSEVLSAMETQLLSRYMKENDLHYGIYIVGWYRCGKWDENDQRRKTRTCAMSIEDLKAHLKNQSDQISVYSDINFIKSLVLDFSLSG